MNTYKTAQFINQPKSNHFLPRGILQRKCACGRHTPGGGECTECKSKKLTQPLQTKLRIGEPNDRYEQEADRVSGQVMRMPKPKNSDVNGYLQAVPLVQRRVSNRQRDATEIPSVVPDVLRSTGQPLDQATRDFMETRFGHDFSGVRIHTDAKAAKSAQAVNAKAYTVGSNVVFGGGQYSIGKNEGKGLLAHELTHVIQQNDNQSTGLIQRAEVDDRSCAGLADIESDIDTKVNADISAARSAAASPMVVADFLAAVSSRLGGRFVGAIETFIQNMANTKRTDPAQDLSNTKFKGVSSVNRFYFLHTTGAAKVVGPAAKVKGICVGADKFGHFFGEGFIYFEVAKASGGGVAGTAAAENTGRFLEISNRQGLGVTGVFSNADLAANLAGKQFYEDLEADPTGFTFSVANYLTNKWNEKINPSFYRSAEASVIWSNLLTGSWKGKFTSAGGSSSPIDAKVALSATATGSVTGINEWPAGAAKPNKEKIKNGKITQRTTAVSGIDPRGPTVHSATPVRGVRIEFDWELGTKSGKGKWESVDEQNLVGTWGIGSSITSGGTWKLNKA